MAKALEAVQYWGLVVVVFLLPIFFLPITTDFFEFNKMVLLVGGVLVLLLVWAGRQLAARRMTFAVSPLDLGVGAVGLVFVVSALIRTPNKMDAFLVPGTATVMLGLTGLYFVVTQTVRGSEVRARAILWSLLLAGLVVALVAIAASLGLFENVASIPPYMKVRTFSLFGSPLPTVTFLGSLVVVLVGKIVTSGKREKLSSLTLAALAALLVVAAVSVGLNMTPGKSSQPRLLPLSTGWAIAVDTLKTSPLGVGPGNFVTAFNTSRPISYNQTDLWNVRFATSSNWYLSVFTEVGIVGLVVFLFLMWQVGRSVLLSGEKVGFLGWTLGAILVALVAIPGNFALLLVFYLVLGLLGGILARDVAVGSDPAMPVVTLIAVAGFALWLGISARGAYAAEMAYKQALDAAGRNDGKGLYDLLVKAVKDNPRVDRYHITLAQTNLLLADAVARKKDVTDQDRQTVNQLVQQGIREGQAAVSLNNQVAGNWENLGRLYRSIIPFAAGADQWAVGAYTQAIALDQANPLLRINLGGIHYGAGRYDEAVKAFELAVVAKPNLANAHFNLAAALREKGDIQRAVGEMEQVIALVDPGSQDYSTAQKELESLKSKLPSKPAAGSGETLQPPSKAPQPVIKPPLELPPESGPPVSPSPTP